jgi:hypothetical protein
MAEAVQRYAAAGYTSHGAYYRVIQTPLSTFHS